MPRNGLKKWSCNYSTKVPVEVKEEIESHLRPHFGPRVKREIRDHFLRRYGYK